MAIRLKWKNPNAGATVVRIYRSATPIDTAALPAPIAEISDGTTSYLDEFPKYGDKFYYVFSVTANGRTLFSPNKQYACVIDLGPGPQDLVLGDFKMGYFGTVSPFELGFPASVYPEATFTTLYKIARNGKILYLPLKTLTVTPNQLTAAKVFTSGVTSRNDPNAGASGMIREYNNRLYAMRVAKLWDDDNLDTNIANYQPSYGTTYTGTPAPLGKSELIDILRIARDATLAVPARFSLNVSSPTADANTPLGSCDYATATAVATVYYQTYDNRLTTLTLNSRTLASTAVFHPVIEYKGLA